MSELLHAERLYSVHPDLRAFARLVAANSSYDWVVVTGIRSLAGVQEKYAIGRTVPGPHAGEPGYRALGLTVTNVSTLDKAPHAERVTPVGLYGCAVDLQFMHAGKLAAGDTHEEQAVYAWYGALAGQLGLTWGGQFTKVDQAHVEVFAWRDYPLPGMAGTT